MRIAVFYGRIVRSVVKELFKNENFFEKLCCGNGYAGKGSRDVVRMELFSDEIRFFLEKDYEERLKLTSLAKDGKDNSFVHKLKKCIKILYNADRRDPSLPKLSDSEVVLMKCFFKNKMRNCDEKLLLVENVLFHNVLRKLAKYFNGV